MTSYFDERGMDTTRLDAARCEGAKWMCGKVKHLIEALANSSEYEDTVSRQKVWELLDEIDALQQDPSAG
jgi:hypothetical protein